MTGDVEAESQFETGSLRTVLGREQIILVGLMGSGKSAIGRRVAEKLAMPFIDADAEIEAAADCTIAEIFARDGETAFREGERQVIKRLLADGRPKVLATGGGAFMDDELRALIKANGIAVWLSAELDILLERTSRRTHRPLLRTGDPRATLQGLIDQRYPIYAEAHIKVISGAGPLAETVTRTLSGLQAFIAEIP